jgi:hypothetical protein
MSRTTPVIHCGSLGGQEHRRGRDVVRRAEPFQRVLADPGFLLGGRDPLAVVLGQDRFRRDAVRAL